MQILSNALAFAFAVSVIVFVHEAGHYLVAKGFGVRVLTFSLGFGRRLWSFRRGDTEYRVSWIPLGGYVHFSGQDPTEATSDPRDFLSQARWRRVLILLAGPAMNVVLAIVLVAIVFAFGGGLAVPADVPAIVGTVDLGSPAERAGLRTADRIIAIDGKIVEKWFDVDFAVALSPDRPIVLEYERGTLRATTALQPDRTERDRIGTAGFHALVLIGDIIPDSAAEAAGIRTGDAVLAINGTPIRNFTELRDEVVGRVGEHLQAEILRSGDRVLIDVVPRLVDGQGMIGVAQVGSTLKELTISEAFVESVGFNVNLTRQLLNLVRKIFERRISLRASLGGPIEIAAVSGAMARRGFRELLLFMGFISLNLFIFNLFPIPILDGGQILILLVESTLRRDLSLRFKERITQVGLVMIVTLMTMAIYFDLSKNLPSALGLGSKSSAEEPQLRD